VEKPGVPRIEQFKQLRGSMAGLLGVERVRRRQFDDLPADVPALYQIALAAKKGTGAPAPVREIKRLDAARGAALAVAGFHLDGMVEGHAVVALIDEAFAAEAGEEAANGFAGKAGHAAKVLVGKLHEEGDGKIGVGGGIVGLLNAGEVEEGAGELTGGGAAKREAACGEHGAVVRMGDRQRGNEADVGVAFHEAYEVGARDALDHARREGFDSNAIEGVLAQRSEADDIAGAGHAEEKEAAFGGGGSKLDSTATDDQEMVGGRAFANEGLVGTVVATDSDGVEVAEGNLGEGTNILGVRC
jgi:hypothetical protein